MRAYADLQGDLSFVDDTIGRCAWQSSPVPKSDPLRRLVGRDLTKVETDFTWDFCETRLWFDDLQLAVSYEGGRSLRIYLPPARLEQEPPQQKRDSGLVFNETLQVYVAPGFVEQESTPRMALRQQAFMETAQYLIRQCERDQRAASVRRERLLDSLRGLVDRIPASISRLLESPGAGADVTRGLEIVWSDGARTVFAPDADDNLALLDDNLDLRKEDTSPSDGGLVLPHGRHGIRVRREPQHLLLKYPLGNRLSRFELENERLSLWFGSKNLLVRPGVEGLWVGLDTSAELTALREVPSTLPLRG